MCIHESILAKSDYNGHVSLFQHLKDVASVITVVSKNVGLDPIVAEEGALLHDIGKVSPIFQSTLSASFKREPGFIFRHEIASLFFLPLVKRENWNDIIDMIIAHHKSVYKDVREMGLLDIDDNCNCFEIHSNGFEKWSPVALELLGALGMSVRPISIDEARESYDYAVEYCNIRKNGCSMWRGLLMAADHIASASSSEQVLPIAKLFITPDLSFYKRQSSLYPLSMISAISDKKHTLVTAPTGAGKTDYLLRRCKGRVFYTLPYQASINAMYDRIKCDLSHTNAQICLLHAASNLKVADGTIEESIMQHHVGASVKVLTPHQIASVAFGIKGYEAMALDLKGCDVILDEVHTYSDVIQAVVLRIIEILVALDCRVHVGTATMPTVLYKRILHLLGGANNVYEVTLNDEELKSFNRHRIFKLHSLEESLNIVSESIEQNRKVLIVVNRVKRAQDIYLKIEDLYPDVDKMLIHSRFKRMDRIRLETLLKEEYNNFQDKPCIVVATQVVEVSLDISFDVMVTECAPIDALIQRFGRINRERSNKTIGMLKPVYVLPPPSDENEALPYSLNVLERTFNILSDNGAIMDETCLQSMIDSVYPEVSFSNIDCAGVAFKDGEWQIKALCHKSKSVLLDAININSAICISEDNKSIYINGTVLKRMEIEIPVSYHSIAHRNFEQLDIGVRPFLIPQDAYDSQLGLLLDKCSVNNYKSFEIL